MRTWAAPLLALALTSALAACGPAAPPRPQGAGSPACPPEDARGSAVPGWVPVVRVRGTTFLAGPPSADRVPGRLVGPVVARVQCRFEGVVSNPDVRLRDGDATVLPVGTELRAVRGSRHDLRLAVHEDGRWRLYEATDVPGARTGADLFELRGRVREIAVLDGTRAERVLRRVRDPDGVARVVDALLAAPVLPERVLAARSGDHPQVTVRLALRDGTVLQRVWTPRTGVFAGRLAAPPALAEVLG